MPVVLIVHVTWTTYRRFPMIGGSEAAFLRRFLPAGAIRLGARVLALGLVQDHAHLILRLPARYDLPRLVQELRVRAPGLRIATCRSVGQVCAGQRGITRNL
jgi:REP element-mobilizing transposase RayT